MRKFTLLLALAALFAVTLAPAQTPGTKGSGEVFFSETFGWGNPADPKGWTAPAGFYFEDPNDQGTNWVWWPPDLGFVNRYTQDPPLQSTTRENGFLALFLEGYNMETGELIERNVDNSVVFPPVDCSQHGSVMVRFQTHFMNYSDGLNFLEISIDGLRWSKVDVRFGCGHKDRPQDKPPGVPAIFEANISDIAAGMNSVIMKMHWSGTYMYYWAFDDFTLAEAYDYDLKINWAKMEWDDGDENTAMSWIYNIPKSQLNAVGGFMNFQSSAWNYGEYDQEAAYLDLDINKNGTSVFHKTTPPVDEGTGNLDTVDIADKYSPVDFGHYKINWEFKGKEADSNPGNNKIETFFNVTDSVYARADDTNDLGWSMTKESYTTAAVENLNHFSGTIYPIFNDCEVSSISVFIVGGKADSYINYRFVLMKVPIGEEDETPYELLTTEMIQLDSAVFNTWVTMPLYKDGESEFLKKGDLVYVGVSQDNTNADPWVRRGQGLQIGTDNSIKLTESNTVCLYDGGSDTGLGRYLGKYNLMQRLNLNDHSNYTDGVKEALVAAALGQNFPNPFNRSTEISYELANGSDVIFEIMDMTGRKVMESNEGFVPSGKHTFNLDASSLQPGVYFYTMKAGDFTETKQMVITQ